MYYLLPYYRKFSLQCIHFNISKIHYKLILSILYDTFKYLHSYDESVLKVLV